MVVSRRMNSSRRQPGKQGKECSSQQGELRWPLQQHVCGGCAGWSVGQRGQRRRRSRHNIAAAHLAQGMPCRGANRFGVIAKMFTLFSAPRANASPLPNKCRFAKKRRLQYQDVKTRHIACRIDTAKELRSGTFVHVLDMRRRPTKRPTHVLNRSATTDSWR
jgi:hypothetical protein